MTKIKKFKNKLASKIKVVFFLGLFLICISPLGILYEWNTFFKLFFTGFFLTLFSAIVTKLLTEAFKQIEENDK